MGNALQPVTAPMFSFALPAIPAANIEGKIDIGKAWQTYQDNSKIAGWTNVGVASVNALVGMVGSFVQMGLQSKAIDHQITMNERMEAHKYDLADKQLTLEDKKLTVTQDLVSKKLKTGEKLARLQANRDVELAKVQSGAAVQIAGKQAAQQLFLQRRYTGAPVQMLV